MIISIYAALLVLFYVALSVRTLSMRRQLKVGIGDGGNNTMTRAMRVHANFAEYVPLALILALLIELSMESSLLIHFVCLTLLVGRCLHAYGVSQKAENFVFRVSGMALTFTSLGTSALVLLVISF